MGGQGGSRARRSRAKACLQLAASEEARDEIEKAGKAGIRLFGSQLRSGGMF